MPPYIRRDLPAAISLFCALSVCAPSWAAPAAAPSPPPTAASAAEKLPELTGAARQRANRLLATFRRNRRFPEQRAAAVADLLALGPAVAAKLLEAVSVELDPLLARYRQDFQQAASAIAARRPIDPQEAALLRQTILALKDDPQLTKETIVSRGDPAQSRLLLLLCVSRDDVFRLRGALKSQRDAMTALGAFWQQARRAIAAAATTTDADALAAAQESFDAVLADAEDAAITQAMPMDEAARRVLADNVGLGSQIAPDSARGIAALNRLRVALALRPLRIDPRLCLAGADHAADMRKGNFFAHQSPVPGKTTFADRAANFGTTASAENIAQARDALTAIDMWWHSPGHHRNMLGDHQRVGLGRSEKYWTQMFGR